MLVKVAPVQFCVIIKYLQAHYGQVISSQMWNAITTLTHWGQDKIAAISQTTFSDPFSGMKMYKFWLTFHWSLFPRIQLTISSIGSDDGLAPTRRQAIIWTNADPIHWRVYANSPWNGGVWGICSIRERWVKRWGPCFNIKTVCPGLKITIMNIRKLWDPFTFKMGILILVR